MGSSNANVPTPFSNVGYCFPNSVVALLLGLKSVETEQLASYLS